MLVIDNNSGEGSWVVDTEVFACCATTTGLGCLTPLKALAPYCPPAGTYAPPGKLLPQRQALLETNLPGLRVVTLDAPSQAQLLRELHALAPSRLPPGRR